MRPDKTLRSKDMKITSLVENQSNGILKGVHGLSLYIETPNHKILFDLGPDQTLFDNAETQGIDLSAVDTVIISHGHADHGGALKRFLEINSTAKIYVQRKAFQKHYAKVLLLKAYIGLDAVLMHHPQIVLADGGFDIDGELKLFTVTNTERCYSIANDTLYTDEGKDTFLHEQNLIIFGNTNVLVMGCGHTGVVNIMEKAAQYLPKVCVGGYHLFNPTTKKTVPNELLDAIAGELSAYDVRYHTCHCTGDTAFRYLSERVQNMSYLSCGNSIDI